MGNDYLDIDRIAFFGRAYKEYLSMFGLDAKPYQHLDDILSFIDSEGIKVEIVEVTFEFQRGANKIMKLHRI